MKDLSEKLKQYSIEVDYIDDDFEDEIELVLVPLRKDIQKDKKSLNIIVEDDKKLIAKYENLNENIKNVLYPAYRLALVNIERLKKAA